MISWIVPIIAAFLLALFGTPIVKRIAFKVKAIDKPEKRKVHIKDMPRLGGLAICVAFWIAVIATQEVTRPIAGLLGGGMIICLVGIWDDIKGLSAKKKLFLQTVAASFAAYMGVQVEFMTSPFNGIIDLHYLTYPVTVLWIVGITNAVNLIDGLDGLAAGVSAIAAVTLGIISVLEGFILPAVLAFTLAASIFGFLKYNFHPAKIFMGDTGSLFLGYNLSVIAILGLTKSTTLLSVFLPIIILGVPILDTTLAIFRRYNNGRPIFSPDKEHLHHRLLNLGLSHRKTVLTIYGISIIMGLSGILITVVTAPQATLLVLFLVSGIFIAADRVEYIYAKIFRDNRSYPDTK